MANIDAVTILTRAKEICAKRGFSWGDGDSYSYSVDQRRYLVLAREQLLDEAEAVEARAQRRAPAWRAAAHPALARLLS